MNEDQPFEPTSQAPEKATDSLETIQKILDNPNLKELLDSDARVSRAINAIGDSADDNEIELFRKICMSLWLESVNTRAIDESGRLLVDIRNGSLQIDPTIEDQGDPTCQQAIVRQIERWVAMDAHGLFSGFSNRKLLSLLDVGAGTCINSVMMREMFPTMEIDAIEPGIASAKTRSIAETKGIHYIQGEIKDAPKKLYDVILLQFVLEHDVHSAKEIIIESLKRLDQNGCIAITVPNRDAFHREFEVAIGKNSRDPKSKLSFFDKLIGHQSIFSQRQLTELIQEAMKETGCKYPIYVTTILPRPFTFDTLIELNRHKDLLKLEEAGPPPDMESQGSVICATVGNNAPVRTLKQNPNPAQALALFKDIIHAQLEKDRNPGGDRQEAIRIVSYLKGRLPNIDL